MKEELQKDIAVLNERPFNKLARIGPLLECLHKAPLLLPEDQHYVDILRRWLVAPYTLWPLDFAGLCDHLCSGKTNGIKFASETKFLLDLVGNIPDKVAQDTVAAYEKVVRVGVYELLIKSKDKMHGREMELADSAEFQADWSNLKGLFRREITLNDKKVIRRSMVQERNFRPDFGYNCKKHKKRFQAVFDAFCFRWNLYGMEGDQPLPLKPSVNITPHGTMIFIPSKISLDKGRDMQWKEIKRLHNIWKVRRQGKVFSLAPHERRTKALLAYRLRYSDQGKSLRGERRYDWLKQQLKYALSTENSTIRKLVSEGRKIACQEAALKAG